MSGLLDLNSGNGIDDLLTLNVESVNTDTSSKPEEKGIPVPGGLKEDPNAKPYDAASIKIPQGATLTAAQYNQALDNLQKSFKEGVEMLGMLRQVTVVEESVEMQQQKFVESALDEALVEAYDNGPIYEAVKREDKGDVKAAVAKLRKELPKALKGTHLKFKAPKTFLRLLLNVTNPMAGVTTQPDKNKVTDALTWWTTRFWQVLGVVYCEDNNIADLINKVNQDFADDLGEYKVLYSPSLPGLTDLWSLKFGWKNVKKVYFLIVDKKIPAELKKIQNDMVAATQQDGNDNNK